MTAGNGAMPITRAEMERVARKAWGEPNRAHSSRHELRFGSNGSKSVDLRSLEWYDFEEETGGGYLKLCQMAGEPIPHDLGESHIVGIYQYRDETGKPLFQVVRRLPRQFSQRRLGPDGRWIWNLTGVTPVLYRLPELLKADPQQFVFIPEGEKHVDALRALGLVATTSPMGAGKWHDRYREALRDRDLVVLPDNDLVGERHAQTIIRSCLGVAKSVRLLRLPNLPVKGDVIDWLGEAQGDAADQLLDMARAARPLTEEQQPQPSSAKLTLLFGEEAAIAPNGQDTIVRGIAHKASLTVIYGAPKSGKSFLATDLALAVADPDRELWMGHRIMQHGPVLYVACEGHGGYWKRLQATGQHVPAQFVLALGRPVLIETEDGRSFVSHPDDVLAAVEAVRERYQKLPALVVVDTVFRSFGSGNVSDSVHMNAYVAAVTTLAEMGISMSCVHHSNKTGGSPAGSVVLTGSADTVIKVEREKNKETGESTRTWEVEAAKDDAEDEPRQFALQVIDGIRDGSGDIVSSCRIVDLGKSAQKPKPEAPKKTRSIGAHAETLWMVIQDMFAEANNGAPHISFAHLSGVLKERGLESRPFRVREHLSLLVMRGNITMKGDAIALAKRPTSPD